MNLLSNFLEESFPGIKANISRYESLGFTWNSRPFLKKDEGQIVSHVGVVDYPLLIEGRQYTAGALHAICTQASHRGIDR